MGGAEEGGLLEGDRRTLPQADPLTPLPDLPIRQDPRPHLRLPG